MSTKLAELVHDLRPRRPASRLLFVGGGIWLLIGAFHGVILATTGGPWSGAVSWRKPIVFSVSTGLLLLTVGWILDQLPNRRRLAASIAWTFLVSASAEVGLITAQAWRGRASHFNVVEAADAAVFIAMGVLVAVMSVCLVAVFVWTLVERPKDPLVRLAVIAGMVLVVTGLGIGQWIVDLGNTYVDAHDAVPATVTNGEAGVPKFPHAVAFHGIQVFILAAVALSHSDRPHAGKRGMLRLTVAAYTGALLCATAQTIAGRGPLEPSVWSLGLAASVLTLGVTLASIARTWWKTTVPVERTPVPVG